MEEFFEIGLTEEGTPYSKCELLEKMKEIGCYAGRPEAPEIWITATYGQKKGLFIRISDLEVAKKFHKDLGDLIKFVEEERTSLSSDNPR